MISARRSMGAHVIVTGEWLPQETFETATGWSLRPEGACEGEWCVPLPDGGLDHGSVHLATVAPRLGMPIVVDAETGTCALGPAVIGGRALTTAEAPDLTLPDMDGSPFHLSSLRGQKVVLVSWAPH